MIQTIAIVSLSAGTIGEDFVKHEVEIGIQRLKDLGLTVRFMPHALEGIEYVKNHPAERAADLIQAFQDQDIDMILCCLNTMNWQRRFQTKSFSVFLIPPSTTSCFTKLVSRLFMGSHFLRMFVNWARICSPIQEPILKN